MTGFGTDDTGLSLATYCFSKCIDSWPQRSQRTQSNNALLIQLT